MKLKVISSLPTSDKAFPSALVLSTEPSRSSSDHPPSPTIDQTHSLLPSSVSVLQWLCNADSTAHSPAQRLLRFFTDLFGCLAKGSRAVFQFYPESDDQVTFIMTYATKAGFGGGLCVDYVRCVFSCNRFG